MQQAVGAGGPHRFPGRQHPAPAGPAPGGAQRNGRRLPREGDRDPHRRILAWHRELIALRRTLPDLTDPDLGGVKVAFDEDARWLVFRRGDVRVAVNLAKEPAAVPLGSNGRDRVLAAWEPTEPPAGDGLLRLPAESAVVLADG